MTMPTDNCELDRVLRAWRANGDGRSSCLHQLTAWIRAVARSHRLNSHDVEDVVQTTWLRLVEHVHEIREPRALGAWLQTAARRESQRVLRERARTQPLDPEALQDHATVPCVELRADIAELEAARRDAALRHAISVLPDAIDVLPGRQRAVMRMFLLHPTPSYADVARELKMPVGSIGPTRARSLGRLRSDPRLAMLASQVEGE